MWNALFIIYPNTFHKYINYELLYLQISICVCVGGTAVAQWWRWCATNRKVAGSIPDGVFGIFYWLNVSHPTMALGSTQLLIFPGGKGGRCGRLRTLAPSCTVVMKSENLNLLEHSGPLQACNGTDLPSCLYVYWTMMSTNWFILNWIILDKKYCCKIQVFIHALARRKCAKSEAEKSMFRPKLKPVNSRIHISGETADLKCAAPLYHSTIHV